VSSSTIYADKREENYGAISGASLDHIIHFLADSYTIMKRTNVKVFISMIWYYSRFHFTNQF